MLNQEGLEWVSTTFGLEPRWTAEPDVEVIARIARQHLGHSEDAPVDVSFYAQGAFNKLYKITTADTNHLLRVALPVYPHSKTASEVSTIAHIRNNASIPVPHVIAFDTDNQNELHYEWVLMEMMPGTSLTKRWRKMTWQAKEILVKQLATFQAQLYSNRFTKICNLFYQNLHKCPQPFWAESQSLVLGPLVSPAFFWGEHLKYDVPRGPFVNSHDWLRSRLRLAIIDQERILGNSEDEDDIEDAEFAKGLAEEILQTLPTIFDPSVNDGDQSMLFHDDLSMQNVLVDDEGNLTAIIDWECVSALPLWRACQLPQLLEGRSRDECPESSSYGPSSDDEDVEADLSDKVDAEGISSVYWEHLLEYELTQLRKVFIDEMNVLEPEWVNIMTKSTLEADLEKAVHNCDNTWSFKIVKRWMKALAEGKTESLADALRR